MPQPLITDPQQDILAEVVLVVRGVLGVDPQSPLPGMDAVRALMVANGTNLVDLETHLRTTGWNDLAIEKLARIVAGEVVSLSSSELTTIKALDNTDLPPCLNFCADMDTPELFIGWAGAFPTGKIELFGRIITAS